MTSRIDGISFKKGTAGNNRVINGSDYNGVNFFVKIKQFEDPNTLLRVASPIHMTSLRAIVRFVRFSLFTRDTILTIQSGMNAKDVTTLTTGGMIADQQVVNSSAKVLYLDERPCLEVMRQLHVGADLRRIQQYIQSSLLLRKEKAAISKGKRIRLRRLANKLNGNVRQYSTFMHVMKRILSSAISFEKEYEKNFVAA